MTAQAARVAAAGGGGGRVPLGDPRLAQRLRREIEGEVLFGRADRGRYATDASIYQVQPVGVVVPRSIEDVSAAMAIAREHGVPVLARGGGTSQCGQTVNRALVIDCTRHLRRVVELDVAARRAWVEPGLVLSHLNAALKGEGLFFPVDPSTNARCSIGGMAGNNSCGSKSIRYGLMADNVRAIDAILADGTRHRFGEVSGQGAGEGAAEGERGPVAALVQQLRALGAAEAGEIAARFPQQLRRVGGYNIEVLTPAARAQGRDNLARLLVGSEGTLAFSAALQLELQPVLPRKVLGICQFPTFRRAMEASRHLVALAPEAVELVDRTMIDLGRGIPIYRPTIDRMVLGEPDSLLIVEFHGQADGTLLEKLDLLDEAMADLGLPGAVVRATDPGFQAAIAEVREAGLNIMMSMKGDGKPVSFIEDCAVGLDDLADYTERLNEVFRRHGTKGTWYAHASVGCLHVRPVLNMKDPADVATMRAVAEECFALVREYKGSHSGEHGDGIVRSEFHESMFGPRIVRAFEAVKDAFDPAGLLNPGRVVRAPRMDDRTLFRYGPGYAGVPVAPALDWSGWPGGLLSAVEMCNNNGTCRGFDAGNMCPSYRVTREEAHVTRGRANTLRLALTGQGGDLASDDVAAAMKLCVSCKACRRECPTGVDMARMKIEHLAARAVRHGVPLRDRLVAELPRYAPFASMVPWLANRAPVRWAGFGRTPPRWRSDVFRPLPRAAGPGRGRERERGREVILFADTFNRHFEPENLRAAARVLRAAGFSPVSPAGAVCCGRTYLSAGMVEAARGHARRTIAALAGDAPVVGLEPSCLLTLRDEFPSLLPGAAAEQLAGRAMLLTEFLAGQGGGLALGALPGRAHVHGHCHQKAFGAFPGALEVLGRVPGLEVSAIKSSCCGMAGAFGYQAETQEASRAMAEAGLLPAVRAAAAEDWIVADGTSCRHQIADLGGRAAVHSAVLLDRAVALAGSLARVGLRLHDRGMSDTPESESKLTRTKQRWAAEGRFLTGRVSRPGEERLPPGQHLVRDWPVLDLGVQPDVPVERFQLRVFGAVEEQATLDWAGFLALPQREFKSDMHCVTTWSRYDNAWRGVSTRDLMALVRPKAEARFVILHSHDGYTTNLPLEDLAAEDAVFATHWEGAPIPRAHGGPVRLVVPHLYLWKSAKWVQRVEFSVEDKPGYWEVRGYHMRGDPWAEERYG